MRLLAINGSHRGDKGHTHHLLDLLFQGASEAGAECEIVSLARQKINRCLACDQCHGMEHYLRCAYHDRDDVASIFDKITKSDVVIYATPVYVFGMSGLMKTFLDRLYSTSDVNEMLFTQSGLLFHHVNHDVCSKPFVSLVCCDNLEDASPNNAVSYFRTFARFMDAPHVGELVRNGGKLAGCGHDLGKQKKLPHLEQIYAAYIQAGRELALYGHINTCTQRIANQEIIPVPFFKILKKFPPFKKVMLVRAKEMLI
jgi:NAD(P)H-dependent FMN reductase